MRHRSMRVRWSGLVTEAVAVGVAAAGWWVYSLRAVQSPGEPHPPKTMTEPVTDNYHGVQVVDPYRWLEDQYSPTTRAWIDTQNRYTRSFLDAWPQRPQLKRRMTELLKIESIGVPTEQNGRLFFVKRRADQDQGVLYLRRTPDGPDEVLVDPNPLSPDHAFSVSLNAVSDDGALVAYGLRQGGEDETTVHFLDVDKHTELAGRAPQGESISISPSSPTRADCITRAVGKSHGSSTTPWARTRRRTNSFSVRVMARTRSLSLTSRRAGVISSFMSCTGRQRTKPRSIGKTSRPTGPIKPIVNDVAARFIGQVGGDTLFVQTNWKAPKNRDPGDRPEESRARKLERSGSGKLCGYRLAGIGQWGDGGYLQ